MPALSAATLNRRSGHLGSGGAAALPGYYWTSPPLRFCLPLQVVQSSDTPKDVLKKLVQLLHLDGPTVGGLLRGK